MKKHLFMFHVFMFQVECSMLMRHTITMASPKFVRPNVRQMEGYTPGEQPAPGERVVKLNTNENPFPPSAKVMQAIREVEPETLRRYPNPTGDLFRNAAAETFGLSPDMILCGNGSDDILTIATRTFVPPGGTLAYPDPTYSLYPVLAKLEEAKTTTVDWGTEWSLPADELIETKADAIYLANPNAPSGTFVTPSQIATLASKFDGLLLVDEAYCDFAEDNCIDLIREFANVVISRTFSKAYSLAGMRFGYAIAQAEVVQEMLKVKDSYNVDAISVIAATAALQDQESAKKTWEYVRGERQRLTSELQAEGWSVLPSQANFVLATVPGGRARDAYQKLKQQGILIRYFDKPGLTDKLRITVGRAEENNALLAGIKSLNLADKAA
jgi:histidinol-phosphate aminotransferase